MNRIASRLGLAAVALAVALGSANTADAQAKKPSKARLAPGKIEVEMTSNDAWKVTVAVDHSDGGYQVDEKVILTVTSAHDGYLYVYNTDSAGAITLIYPNKYYQKNEIRANQAVTIPDPGVGGKWWLRADKAGAETFKAIVSTQPLNEVDMKEARSRDLTPVSRNKFIRVAVEAMGGDPNSVPPETQGSPHAEPPDGKKPEVVVQKEKIQQTAPVQYEKKKKEWATGMVGITIVPGKPTQDKPTQDKPKPVPTPDKPIQVQDKPKPPSVPDKPIQTQDKPKPPVVIDKPTQDKPKPVPTPDKPIQTQDKPKPVPTPDKPSQDKPGQDKPKPPVTAPVKPEKP